MHLSTGSLKKKKKTLSRQQRQQLITPESGQFAPRSLKTSKELKETELKVCV